MAPRTLTCAVAGAFAKALSSQRSAQLIDSASVLTILPHFSTSARK